METNGRRVRTSWLEDTLAEALKRVSTEVDKERMVAPIEITVASADQLALFTQFGDPATPLRWLVTVEGDTEDRS